MQIVGGPYLPILRTERKQQDLPQDLSRVQLTSPLIGRYDQILQSVRDFSLNIEGLYDKEDIVVRAHDGFVYGVIPEPDPNFATLPGIFSASPTFRYAGFQISIELYRKVSPGWSAPIRRKFRNLFFGKAIGAVRDTSTEYEPKLQIYVEKDSPGVSDCFVRLFADLGCEVAVVPNLF